MKFYVQVVGGGESVVEFYDTKAEMDEAFEVAINLIEDKTYTYAECGEYENGKYTKFDWVDYDDLTDEYCDDVDECGFDPYEGCYTYDC